MRYYVVADIHGFYTELYNALAEKGFFTDTEPHKLIVCGDLFDRGKEAVKVQSFVSDLMERDEVILIRGNHEDLTLCLIQDWENFGYMQSHHISNGTVDTVLQLTGNEIVVGANARAIKNELLNTPFIEDIIPKMLDYYETKKAAAVEYYKRYPMTDIYANLPIDSELFMSALVGIIDDEKEYKKAVKGGYTKLIVYTDPKTRFQMLAKFPTTESMEKYIAEKGITVERKYEKIEDFTIE